MSKKKLLSESQKLNNFISEIQTVKDIDIEDIDENQHNYDYEYNGEVDNKNNKSKLRQDISNVPELYKGKVINRKDLEFNKSNKSLKLSQLSDDIDDEELISDSEGSVDFEGDDDNIIGSSGEYSEGEEEGSDDMSSEEEGDDDDMGEAAFAEETMEDLTKTLNDLEVLLHFYNLFIFKEEDKKVLFAAPQNDEKAEAVKSQCTLWDASMDLRIRLQTGLNTCNKLPLPTIMPYFINQPNIKSLLQDAINTSKALISDLKSLALAAMPNAPISDRFDPVADGIDSVIEYWSEKTLLSRGVSLKKFTALSSGLLPTIKSIYADEERVFNKTSKKRKNVHLGESFVESKEGDEVKKDGEDELDFEIYDDADFYTLLLKDVIAGGDWKGDVAELAATVKQAKAKSKKRADSKANKGKKINYAVQPKLVNFMVPIPYNDDFMADELFLTLFGKKPTN